MSSTAPPPTTTSPPAIPRTTLTWFALFFSLLGAAGSIYLSVGMGLKACPLCYYQRSFMLGTLGVLALGLLSGMGRVVSLSTLVLPLAVAGLGVAGFHVKLELQGALECPAGVLGLGTAPQQSLAAFVLLTLLLSADACCGPRLGSGLLPWLGSLILGGVFAYGCLASTSKLPVPPDEYDHERPTICRPPKKPA